MPCVALFQVVLFMSPAVAFNRSDEMRKTNDDDDDHVSEIQYQQGVKHLHETGISRVPRRYIFPDSDRPNEAYIKANNLNEAKRNLQLPIIDLSELFGPNRAQVLNSIAVACEEYGIFQVA